MIDRCDIEKLRKRAQWYRDFADVGSDDSRALRHALARHFDRMADEFEAAFKRNGPG